MSDEDRIARVARTLCVADRLSDKPLSSDVVISRSGF